MTPRTTLVVSIAGLAAAAAIVFGLARQMGVKSYGSPAGRVVRAGNSFAVLMEQKDPYMPSLKGRAESDMSYSYELWVIPETGDGSVRKIRLDRGVRSGDRAHAAGAQAFENGVVWLRVKDLKGIELATGAATIRAAPPAIANAGISQLLGSSEYPLEQYRADSISIAPGQRLYLLNDDEAAKSFKPGARFYDSTSTATGTGKKRTLQLVTQNTAPDAGVIPSVGAVTRVGTSELRNGAFMRSSRGGEVVRFTNPDGFLVVHESGISGDGSDPTKPTIRFSRVHMDGTIAWTADTTIGRLTDILPHDRLPALVGEPNDLTRRVLSVVHLDTGAVKTVLMQMPAK